MGGDFIIIIRDKQENVVFTGELIKPNIVKVVCYYYREGYVTLLLKEILNLMETHIKPGDNYHSLWIYKKGFYDANMFTEADFEESLADLKYMANRWNRVTSISVLEKETIGSKINDEMAKNHLKPTTKRFLVGSEEEAMLLIKLYDLQKNNHE